MSRKRGRIVLLGVTGLELQRQPYFEKELTFQVSCSYGPGRYDPDYEDKGRDYPIGYVRWTEGRNFEAILDLLAAGRLDVQSLVTDRIPFAEAQRAWDLVSEPRSLGILLEYPSERVEHASTVRLESVRSSPPASSLAQGGPRIAVIGAGNFAARTLLPALAEAGVKPVVIAAPGGLSASLAGRTFGAERVTSDVDAAITAPDVDTVFILTRHDSHADLVCRALAAGKHVFVEKPLCTTLEDLERIKEAYGRANRMLMVGFNRRWAPHTRTAMDLLREVSGPKTIVMTINAGAIPGTHWTQDAVAGGGRIIGEACHFIDLARFLTGSPFTSVHASPLGGHSDSSTITLTHEDGSVSTIHYISTGHPRFPKERIEIFAGGRIIAIDNFRRLHAYGWPMKLPSLPSAQNKGHAPMVIALLDSLKRGVSLVIPSPELYEVAASAIVAATERA